MIKIDNDNNLPQFVKQCLHTARSGVSIKAYTFATFYAEHHVNIYKMFWM